MQPIPSTDVNIIPFRVRASRGSNPLDQVLGICKNLEDRKIEEIVSMLEGLLEARQSEAERLEAEADWQVIQEKRRASGKPAKGWFELKMIGDCGPYQYLRWYDGKRKPSKYIGKAKGDGHA